MYAWTRVQVRSAFHPSSHSYPSGRIGGWSGKKGGVEQSLLDDEWSVCLQVLTHWSMVGSTLLLVQRQSSTILWIRGRTLVDVDLPLMTSLSGSGVHPD